MDGGQGLPIMRSFYSHFAMRHKFQLKQHTARPSTRITHVRVTIIRKCFKRM